MQMVLVVVRWILLIPATIAAAVVAYAGVRLVWYLTMSWYFDPDSWFSKIYLYVLVNGIAGFAAIHAAHWVAPSHKVTGVVLGLVALVLTAGASATGLLVGGEDYINLLGIALTIAGAVMAALKLIAEEKQSPSISEAEGSASVDV